MGDYLNARTHGLTAGTLVMGQGEGKVKGNLNWPHLW